MTCRVGIEAGGSQQRTNAQQIAARASGLLAGTIELPSHRFCVEFHFFLLRFQLGFRNACPCGGLIRSAVELLAKLGIDGGIFVGPHGPRSNATDGRPRRNDQPDANGN